MPNTYFKFKRFTIHHDRCAMKVGTDGVLLGAWAKHPGPKTILDIGAGTGLIGLMLAQRFPESRITGVEIDPEASLQAKENVTGSEFSDRVSIINTPIQELETSEKFDLIVCNPPFFKVTSQSESEQRNMARQLEKLRPEELLEFSAKHLHPNGNLSIIFPAESDLEESAAQCGLYVQSKVLVKGNAGAPVKRILWQFGKKAGNYQTTELIIEKSRAIYTEEFVGLVKDFYLYH